MGSDCSGENSWYVLQALKGKKTNFQHLPLLWMLYFLSTMRNQSRHLTFEASEKVLRL
jgi:hypothetical protein